MTAPTAQSAPFINDPDMADVIEAAAERPARDRKELNGIVSDLLVALVRLIVSVVSRPLNAIVHKAVAERLERERELLVMKVRDSLHDDIAAKLRGEYDARLAALEASFDEKVSLAVADTVRRQRASIVAEIRAEFQVSTPATSTPARPAAPSVQYIFRDPDYPFTLLAALIGAVIGGFGSWWLTRYFEQATVIDEAGRNWIATSIAADPMYAYIFIGIGAFVVGVVGAFIGYTIDFFRNRNR